MISAKAFSFGLIVPWKSRWVWNILRATGSTRMPARSITSLARLSVLGLCSAAGFDEVMSPPDSCVQPKNVRILTRANAPHSALPTILMVLRATLAG